MFLIWLKNPISNSELWSADESYGTLPKRSPIPIHESRYLHRASLQSYASCRLWQVCISDNGRQNIQALEREHSCQSFNDEWNHARSEMMIHSVGMATITPHDIMGCFNCIWPWCADFPAANQEILLIGFIQLAGFGVSQLLSAPSKLVLR